MQTSRTAVVIVNWNSVDETRVCLRSLEAIQPEWTDCFVVDNASVDGSADLLRREFSWARLIETGANLGYAGGNNLGIRVALREGAEWVLVLNNDTVARAGLVRETRSVLEADPTIGIAGPTVYRGGQSRRFWYAGGRILDRPFRARHIVEPPASEQPFPVDYVPGCALLASRTLLETVGQFDERFFLTWEDADLCTRARRAGLGCVIVPTAAVDHTGSVSFDGLFSPLYAYYYFRNMLLFARLHVRLPARARAYRDTLGLARATIRNASSTRGRRPLTAAILLGFLHFLLRKFGPAPARLTRSALVARMARASPVTE